MFKNKKPHRSVYTTEYNIAKAEYIYEMEIYLHSSTYVIRVLYNRFVVVSLCSLSSWKSLVGQISNM